MHQDGFYKEHVQRNLCFSFHFVSFHQKISELMKGYQKPRYFHRPHLLNFQLVTTPIFIFPFGFISGNGCDLDVNSVDLH